MDNHKKIGNALKNRLDNLNYESSDKVWDNITKELDNNKNKKLVAFWWKIGIISSVILIVFFVFYINKKDLNLKNNHTTIKGVEIDANEIKNINNNNNNNNNSIISTNEENSLGSNKSQIKNDDFIKSTNQKTNNNVLNINHNLKKSTTVNESVSKTGKKRISNLLNTNVVVLNKEKLISNISYKEDSIKNNNMNVVILNDEKFIKNKSNKEGFDKNRVTDSLKNSSEKINNLLNTNVVILKEEKIIKNKSDKETKIVNKAKDSIKHINNIESKKKIAKINKFNSNIKSKTKTPWQVNFKFAPIFSGSYSKGSSLGKNVKNNSKNKKITLSYGVSAEMELNKKTKLRAGVNKLNLSNITNQVSSENVIGNTSISINDFDFLFHSSNPNLPLAERQFNITQKTTYIELPFEIIHNLTQKKININTVTGFSFLFLDTNTLLVDNAFEFGSVNNLKSLSFTGNLGVEFNYKLTKKIQFNIEPILKIQFNTYKDNIDYKPYFFGVYSGFSYKF